MVAALSEKESLKKKMCFNLPYTLRKGKLVIIRKWNEEEKEDIGLLVKEIEKWNKINTNSKPTTKPDHDEATSQFSK